MVCVKLLLSKDHKTDYKDLKTILLKFLKPAASIK